MIIFDNMISDMLSNKKFNPILTELFIRGRNLDISLTQSYFAVTKNVRPNSTYYFIRKIPNKRELRQIAFNHSSNVDFTDFMNPYKKCTVKPYRFLDIDAPIPSDNPLHFRQNFLQRM